MIEKTSELSWRAAAAIAAAVIVLFGALGLTASWHLLEIKGFDELTVRTAPMKSSLPITIVGIDEASLAEIQKKWPWPTSLYGKVVDELVRLGALAIVFDVVIAEPSTPAEDGAFAAAIQRAGNVVLAADMAYQEKIQGAVATKQWIRVNPLQDFVDAGARRGLAVVTLDRDGKVRRVPDGDDVLWKEVIRRVNDRQPGMLTYPEPAPGAMIRYVGPDHTFPYVSFYQALNAATHLPPDAFNGQIVLIGRDLKTSPDAEAAAGDVFSTPFLAETGWYTPGVELHANTLETVLTGQSVEPAPEWWGQALLVGCVLVSAWLMRRWRPILSALVALALVAALGTADWLLFVRMNIWLPVAGAAIASVTMYIAYGAVAYVTERKRKGEIRRAFGLYVSPEVVDHVMDNPGRLKLGGERREVTMFFTDLEGFTTLTERLGAEQVTTILNQHFTRATAIIKRHRGTVSRFMGDAIMAMWGAPVEDPQQAEHALLAACEVQEEMEKLRADLVAQGLPVIRMRIGIHSCVAVVGNLGATDRFEYTAIGDGVNLAARLEGVNKLYHTGILTSGETATKAAGAVPMRIVDRVIVKGKSEPVDIYTPCNDPQVVEITARAVAAYRAQRWEEAESLFRELLARDPSDGVASVYVERIRRLRVTAPAADWGGAVELEKL